MTDFVAHIGIYVALVCGSFFVGHFFTTIMLRSHRKEREHMIRAFYEEDQNRLRQERDRVADLYEKAVQDMVEITVELSKDFSSRVAEMRQAGFTEGGIKKAVPDTWDPDVKHFVDQIDDDGQTVAYVLESRRSGIDWNTIYSELRNSTWDRKPEPVEAEA